MVTQKRVYRLKKWHRLLVQPKVRLKVSRISHRPKPKTTAPNRWWGIDMTKVLIEGFRWVYVVLVLDWSTKKIVGHNAGAGEDLTLGAGVKRRGPAAIP